MLSVVDIDAAIDGFVRAIASAGLPAPSPPSDLSSLHELEAEIAPLRVPPAVRRFWQRIDATTLRAHTYPGLCNPDFALRSWRSARDEFAAYEPLALVLIAYESHQCMSVELDQPGVEGGALFEWNVVDGDFERRFDDLQGWLVYLTELLETARFAVQDHQDGRIVLVPSPEDWEAEPGWRPELSPHPLYGTVAEIGRDILEWPEHWQRLNGLEPERLTLRGATHTIAELTATDPARPADATLLAQVVSLVETGAAATVRVDDGTGMLVIHCPATATLLGPVLGDWFEFDVTVPAGRRQVPVDPDAVELAQLDPERALEERFLAQYAQPAGATATAVRRAPAP